MKRPIYLDYMSTTPVDPAVIQKMQESLSFDGFFGNPASQQHRYGWEAGELVKQARQEAAELVNADSREIIWTSGATEANNLAIKGAAFFYQRQGKHIITMSTEHKAVLNTCRYLMSKGFDVTFLDPEPNGLLDLSKLNEAVRSDTILASIMHVNNETGVIQNIAAIGDLLKEKGVLFHVDAAQSIGKLPIDLQLLKVDLLSFSGHKFYGPKGIGALYVRRKPRVRLEPLFHGGGQEWGLRSGTLATHQIVGMGMACTIAKKSLQSEYERMRGLRSRLWEGIGGLNSITVHGEQCIPGCLNIGISGVDGEVLMRGLNDLALSSGSACTSAIPEPSHVLLAMGLTREQANCSLRISFGRFTTEEEIDYAAQQICKYVM